MNSKFDMPLNNLLEIMCIHRGLTREQAIIRLCEALDNMNGTYTVMGRLPDEVIAHGRGGVGVVLRRGLDAPPDFDISGRAIEPPETYASDQPQLLGTAVRGDHR